MSKGKKKKKKNTERLHTVVKNDKGTWSVMAPEIDPEGGHVATFAVKWEAQDFADELNSGGRL